MCRRPSPSTRARQFQRGWPLALAWEYLKLFRVALPSKPKWTRLYDPYLLAEAHQNIVARGESPQAIAAATMEAKSVNNTGIGSGKAAKIARKTSGIICDYCHKPGHRLADCRTRIGDERRIAAAADSDKSSKKKLSKRKRSEESTD